MQFRKWKDCKRNKLLFDGKWINKINGEDFEYSPLLFKNCKAG